MTSVRNSHRGRPRDATRQGAILAAGFDEFAEKGFLAARLEDVAARAGVAKGTVYLYFENKDALFQAAVRARVVPMVGEVTQITRDFAGSSCDLLHHALTAVYARLSNPEVRTLLRIVLAEGPRFPDLLRFYYSEVIAKMLALIDGIVQRGVERGEFQPSAMTQFSAVFVAPALMAAVWQMTFAIERPVPIEQFRAAHLDMLTRALTGQSPAAQSELC